MAEWEETLVLMVRHLIGDLAEPPNFTDYQIQGALVVAGLIVSNEYPFTTIYAFDLMDYDIIPDPVATGDNLAIALIALKAACMLNMNSYQGAVGDGIRVRDGSSEIDLTGSFSGWKDIIANGVCASYKKLLDTTLNNTLAGAGGAVYGPYTSECGYNGLQGRYRDTYDFAGFWDSFMR